MKEIKVINKANLPTIPFETLKKDFEANGLKQKKNRDIGDLKKSIVADGFKIPIFVWLEGKYITDGAGRVMALELLEYEGYKIPDIPYISLEASNKREAKKLTLMLSSQHGEITEESIGEYLIGMNEMDLGFINIAGHDLTEIKFTPKKLKIDTDTTKKVKGQTKLKHQCPNCSFEWTS